MTFSDPSVQDLLARSFVCVKVNLVPSLKLGRAAHHSEELLAQFPEGGGGGNVRSIFCTRDGRIVSEVKGFWGPERYTSEVVQTLSVIDATKDDIAAFHGQHVTMHKFEAQMVESQQAALEVPEPKPSPSARRIAALNRMSRSHRESIDILDTPVEEYLDRIADEVWTKGNVG